MKRCIILIYGLLLVALTASGKAGDDVNQARELAGRLSPRLAAQVDFTAIQAEGGRDVFTLESRAGRIVIGGNNAGSMAVGLNRYLNRYCKTTVSWYADVPLQLPDVLPAVPAPERVDPPGHDRRAGARLLHRPCLPAMAPHGQHRRLVRPAARGVARGAEGLAAAHRGARAGLEHAARAARLCGSCAGSAARPVPRGRHPVTLDLGGI